MTAGTQPHHLIRARQPAGRTRPAPRIGHDPDVLAAFLEDAAHFPGGVAAGIAVPTSEAEVAALLRFASTVLPIGAQSSLTGGATPRGDVLLSTARLNRIVASGDDWIRVQAGVTLVDLRSGARQARPVLPAGADVHRRVRRRHRRHQRRRGGDVQIRHHARAGCGR